MLNKRKISPPQSELNFLRQPLTDGERNLIAELNRSLPPVWEIYIQPHLNGLCPDLVLLNPFVGIVIFEIKDWDFSAMTYDWETRGQGNAKTLIGRKDGKSFKLENPIQKAQLYKKEILDLYCPSVSLTAIAAPVVASCVVFSKLTSAAARAFYKQGFHNPPSDQLMRKYHPAIGYDAPQIGLANLIDFFGMRSSKYMNEHHATDLRFWLDEPRAKHDQRANISLSPAQRSLLSRERTKNGFRRIRGSAGSGKSMLLAAKAAAVAAKDKKVLVVSYNVTLGNYLGDLVSRASLPGTNQRKKIEFLHYHAWARRVCILTGNSERYRNLSWESDLDGVLSEDLPQLVKDSLAETGSAAFKYDAVLVDEGQDFKLAWWQTLALAVKQGGEAILVADKTQDLYETADAWTDSAMKSAGFDGRWNELKQSYRLPLDYLPHIRNFLDRFIVDDNKIEPEPIQRELVGLSSTHMRWIQTDSSERSESACIEAVLKFPLQNSKNEESVTYPDVVILAETMSSGMSIVKGLGAHGIKVRHTFGTGDPDARVTKEAVQRQKVGFFLGAEQVKATTIHSFKGWESTCLVIQLNANSGTNSAAAAYTALTRLKASEQGEDSFITVVCSDPRYSSYGQTWPSFERWPQSR